MTTSSSLFRISEMPNTPSSALMLIAGDPASMSFADQRYSASSSTTHPSPTK